ncbi:TIGR00645 family protein [Luteimonas sp. R10]|uniref:TIGR00645 family protein n=1 Tax=Luteimonas sp. R10 TaxID=3108176 RepID=UPI003091E2E6|nr:TIGR00645 family protein [Luteimonas sp. R10]
MSVPPSARLNPLPALIFSSRWLQLPLYLGLIVAQGVYVFLFGKELWHLLHGAGGYGEQEIMLIVLGLIDVVMISNLLVMVIVGGYETFVSRLRLEGHPDQPEWLSHVNASVLKVKLAMAIIGISSIHLLKTFIEAGMVGGLPLCGTIDALEAARAYAEFGSAGTKTCTTYTAAGVMWQATIHTIFILSAIGIAWTDKLMQHTASKREHVAHG